MRAGERLVNFIHPQDCRGDRFGHGDGAADIFLGRTDQAPKHPAHVETQQRQLPLRRHGLGAQTFAAALHAEHQNAARRGQAELACLDCERRRALVQPVLEHGKPADVSKAFVGGVIFQQAALADNLLFLVQHVIHVVTAEAVVADDDLGKNIFGLAQRQAEGGGQQPLAIRVSKIYGHLCVLRHVGDDLVQQPAQVVAGRQGEIQDGDLLFQFSRNHHHRRDDQDGLETVLQVQRDFLELADHGEIVAAEERMKILEDEQCRLDLLDHLVQRGERILGGGAAVFLGLDRSAGGDDAGAAAPLVDFFMPPPRDLHRQILHAHLLARDDVQNRITRADQGFEFGLEVHLFLIS